VSLFDTMALNAFTALQKTFGEPAMFTAQAAGSMPKTIKIIVGQTLPAIISSDDTGQQQDRVIYAQVGVADVPTPARGDLYQIFRADHAGVWIAERTEKSNAARWLLALRLMTHPQMAGQGAQQVRT